MAERHSGAGAKLDCETQRGHAARLVALAAVAVFATHLLLSWRMRAPILQSDEGGYLGIARYFANGTGLAASSAPYTPGYGLLLTPLAALLSSPLGLWRAALVTNAALTATIVPLSYCCAGHLSPALSPRRRLLLAVVVGLYPSFLESGSLAISFNLFVPLVLLAVILAARAWIRDEPYWWLAAGAVAGTTTAVHPVGVVVDVAFVAAGLFGIRSASRRGAVGLVALVAGVVSTAVPARFLAQHVTRATERLAVVTTSSGAPVQNRLGEGIGRFRQNLRVSNLGYIAAALGGQWIYLVVATAGLFLLGLWYGFGAARRTAAGRGSVSDRIATLIAAIAAGTLFVSAVNVIPVTNVGHGEGFFYGRYNEEVLAPILLLGLVAFWQSTDRQLRRWLVVVGISLALGATLVAVLRPDAAAAPASDLLSLLGLHVSFALLHRLGVNPGAPLGLTILVCAGVAATMTLLVIRRRVSTVGALATLAIGFVGAAAVGGSLLVGASSGRAEQRRLVPLLEQVGRLEPRLRCVSYTVPNDGAAEWLLANDQFFLSAWRLVPLVSTRSRAACGPLVLAADRRAGGLLVLGGARELGVERNSSLALLVLPGPVLERVADTGLFRP